MIGLLLAFSTASMRLTLLEQTQLDGISIMCSTPREWLQSREGTIIFDTGPNAKYGEVDCLFAALRKLHAGPIAIIGNDAYGPGAAK